VIVSPSGIARIRGNTPAVPARIAVAGVRADRFLIVVMMMDASRDRHRAAP
jgi:hypothetical protein